MRGFASRSRERQTEQEQIGTAMIREAEPRRSGFPDRVGSWAEPANQDDD